MKSTLLTLVAICLLSLSLTAQSGNVGIGTTTPQARLHVQGDMVAIDTINESAPADPPVAGTGTRMMWYGDKAAFRVGRVIGSFWDKTNIGFHSFAAGYNTKANGNYTTALGFQTEASGIYATALGVLTKATEPSSFAVGDQTTASGISAVALGSQTDATGDYSTAIGYITMASGSYSTAMGDQTTASGRYSTAMGQNTTALGRNSTAMGFNTRANSYGLVALGRFNKGGGNAISWEDTDPLFEIGIGTDENTRVNAMMIRKDAAAYWGGVLNLNMATLVDPPATGAGTRMMWYPEKAAFRVGHLQTGATATYWDKDSIGYGSFAAGIDTKAPGGQATSFGFRCSATGTTSVAMGNNSNAKGESSLAGGVGAQSIGLGSVALGVSTTAEVDATFAAGFQSKATKFASSAIGQNVTASGDASTAGGYFSTASGNYSTAVGHENLSSARSSTSFGEESSATSDYATAIGFQTMAAGTGSVALGFKTLAGNNAFAGGNQVQAQGFSSVAMGHKTSAPGIASVAIGDSTSAPGNSSTAFGKGTRATGFGTHVVGMYNDTLLAPQAFRTAETPAFIVGNGTSPTARSNAMLVKMDGTVGIGTNTPTENLVIGKDIGSYPGNRITIGDASDLSGINVGEDENNRGYMLWQNTGNYLTFGTESGGTFYGATLVLKDGSVGMGGINSPAHPLHMVSGAHVTSAGVWTNASDLSKKYNIHSSTYGLAEVLRMKPVTYNYKVDDSPGLGFIAQEMEAIIPEAVSGQEGHKGIAYGTLTSVLTNAIKELNAENQALKSRNEQLQLIVNDLLSRVEALEDTRKQ